MISNGQKSVSISKVVHSQGLDIWDYCLIGQFYGAAPKISLVHAISN